MNTSLLSRLQRWFLINCNGDWEHSYGIKVYTLDNPGWTLRIDLSGTCLEELQFEYLVENSPHDWMHVRVTDMVLIGSSDVGKLETLLELFLDRILPEYADADFMYEVYIPLQNGPHTVWHPVYARATQELHLEIAEVGPIDRKKIRAATDSDIDQYLENTAAYLPIYSQGHVVAVQLMEMLEGTTLVATLSN